MLSDSQRNVVLIILAAVLWSSSGLLVKVITWSPLAILGARRPVNAGP